MKIKYFWILPLAAVVLFASCGDDNGTEALLAGPIKAEPGIIGVDSQGNLTLDGYTDTNPAYVVYFKWGSLVAMKGPESGDWTNGITDIAWVPEEYESELGYITDYTSVPYADEVNYPGSFPPQLPAEGLGDPCLLAQKDGVAGGYRMPTGNPYEQFTDAGWEESGGTFGQVGRKSTEGQFYPASGYRNSSDGAFYNVGSYGAYWSSSPTGVYAYYLLFYSTFVSSNLNSGRSYGCSIRCVPL